MKRRCQAVPCFRIFDKLEIMCRLTIAASHHDNPMIRKPHPFSEVQATSDIGHDHVSKVRVDGGVVSDEFQAGPSIDEDDDLAL